jgi:hypothetical protein
MNTVTKTTKKITIATVKSFVRKNIDGLFINVKSKFDGMTDCVESRHDGFGKAAKTEDHKDHTLGVSGAWFVGGSRDYFTAFENEDYTGIQVSNSCGRFVLAIKK